MTEEDLYIAAFKCHDRKLLTPQNSRSRMMYRAHHIMKYGKVESPTLNLIFDLGFPKHKSLMLREEFMFKGIESSDIPKKYRREES